MRQNVGTLDAYLRIAAGLLVFGWGLRSHGRTASLLLMAVGASKVAEGITRWCPTMDLLGMDTLEDAEQDASETISPRYGQISRNPYRTLPDENALDDEPDLDEEEPRRVRRLRLRRRPAMNRPETLGSSNHRSSD